MRYRAPLFIRVIFHSFLRVGLCSHTVLPFAGDVDARRASDSVRMTEIAWTRVHTIIKSGTCTKDDLSDAIKGLTLGHVALRESPDRHQTKTARSRSDGHGDARSSSNVA